VTRGGPNAFLGSFDHVLDRMDQVLGVDIVLAPKGHLRNMRLERRLRDAGVDWREVSSRDSFLEHQQNLGALDVCTVAGFSWKIPQSMIDNSRVVVNCHPGDLLVCRGPQPIEAALYHRHETLGVCVHLIDGEEMDSGPLLTRALMSVDTARDYRWHQQQLLRLLVEQAGIVFSHIQAGEPLQATPWDVSASHWYPRLPAEVLKKLYLARTLADFHAVKG
jgi:methionyl-tRNA formyltransferase